MTESLIKAIEDIAGRIAKSQFSSEAAVSQGIVLRLLRVLGWPVDNPRIVVPQFDVGDGKKVDYALCHPEGTAIVLIEVKKVGGLDARGEKQLFRYCVDHGVAIAVLTDGQMWSCFLPAGQGRTYEERRFAQLDLIADSSTAFADSLTRYLAHSAVTSGKCEGSAKKDHERERLHRVCGSVWRRLIQRPADGFLDMFLKAMKRETTIDPSRDAVASWIRERAAQEPDAKPDDTKPDDTKPEKDLEPSPRDSQHWVEFHGRRRYLRSGIEVLVEAFTRLAEKDVNFCRRYSEQHRGRKKLRVAQTRRAVHPDDRILRRRCRQLPGGWWIDSNLSDSTKVMWIRQACEVAQVRFGHDLVIHFPNDPRA
ncbi:hypothetical protein [Candidatus Palauibacter sp.]|uniref:hypothetical protein n=1 Tax=Candidatus Palauibacter sp. TaxID=3101350 RepID=UPI003B52BE48